MFAMVYEVVARYAFTAPTVWAYDVSRMLYGALFVLGAGYALSKGVHIRSDFLYRKWAIRTQGRVDTALYLVFYFPAMLIFLWVATQWGWASVVRGERGMDTAWMPLLGPVKTCLPIGIVFLLIQGISELLKSIHAARTGRWPQ
jgi:TRAP-type mannitol/chloroaromatic compound transport system permease small subunit